MRSFFSLQLIAFLCCAAQVLKAQNIGIGANSPNAKLHIRGTHDTSQLVIDGFTTQTRPFIRLRNSSGEDHLHIRANSPYNTFYGLFAGANSDVSTGAGLYNTFIGSNSGVFTSIGQFNTGLGRASLYQNIGGWYNTALGFHTLFSNINGQSNTAVGSNALDFTTDGSFNTGIGAGALYANVTGSYNAACGHVALGSNTTGSYNTAFGNQSLYQNVSGSSNIAIGESSGVSTPGNFNNTISIGNYNLLNAASNQAFFGNLNTVWNGGNVGWSTYSDARIKNNIRQDVKGLDFIMRLNPVTYFTSIRTIIDITGNKDDRPDYSGKYDADNIRHSGFLAQEVAEAAKESGYNFSGITHIPKNDKELYTLSYEQFVVPLVKAVQELNIKVNGLIKENEDLKRLLHVK
jgi:trimeric autotransporter adhesin